MEPSIFRFLNLFQIFRELTQHKRLVVRVHHLTPQYAFFNSEQNRAGAISNAKFR